MTSDEPSSSKRGARVLDFRRSQAAKRQPPVEPAQDVVRDLKEYEHGPHENHAADDYRHRMIVNAAAFVFVIALIGAGLWLADTMARMRKDQDCVLSGRRGCTPVEVIKDRW